MGIRHQIMVMVMGIVTVTASANAQTQNDTVRLSLGDAARLAAQQNTQVLEARARVSQARSRITTARAALLPQVSGLVTQSAHTLNTATFGLEFPSPPGQPPLFDPNGEVIGPVKLTDLRGRLSQTLFDLSALKRVKGANAVADAATAQMEAAEQRAGVTAANAYVQVFRAQQLHVSRQADLALAKELLDMAKQQLQSGTAVRLDVTRAEAQLATVNSQLVTARNAVQRARLGLARALGLPATTVLVLADSLPNGQVANTTAEEAIRIAMEHRADLRAVQAQIRAADLQLSATRAERLPSLSFVGADGVIGKNPSHLLHTYDWAFQVSVPVFTGLRNRARVEEQNAQISELQARRHDIEEQFGFEIRTALLDVSAANEQIEAASSRLRFAQQELSDARDRYQSGVAGSGDVVTASLRLNEARTAYNDALVAYQTARVALAAAEGNVTELP
ncbi:MAG TPA: TolC family protein [Longimicrobiales bacterium]|nr:TolC family protein [Longimicrobiales bacterium]